MSNTQNTLVRTKKWTNAAKRWCDAQLELTKASPEGHMIKVSETGRLSAEDIADFFQSNRFVATISPNSDYVNVVKR